VSPLLDGLSDAQRDLLVEREQPGSTRPMLATLTHDPFDDDDWIYERKLDGVRLLVFRKGGEVRLTSRNGKDRSATWFEVRDAFEAMDGPDLVVDGEVVAFSGDVTSFRRLQTRMQVQHEDEARERARRVTVYFYAFDLLHADGFDVTALPLAARKSLLRRALDFSDPVRWTPHRRGNGLEYLEEACGKGWEGLIAKRGDSPYVHSRSKDWLKFKCVNRQELVVGGFTDPKGERMGFGALLVGYYEDGSLRYAGKVGTGFTQELLRSLRARMDGLERKTSPFADQDDPPSQGVHWVTPKLVGEVGFTEWTDDGRLRHPRFVGIRDDKEAGDVVREEPAATPLRDGRERGSP
jgi:DNA ligase D-like protein (predicted ligase)